MVSSNRACVRRDRQHCHHHKVGLASDHQVYLNREGLMSLFWSSRSWVVDAQQL
jgi:hypothetical protein